MGKIFKGQTKLKIWIDCKQNITGAVSVLIKYRKPSGTEGSWTATVDDAAAGLIYYEPASTAILDEVGAWVVWSYVEFSDNRVAPGEPDAIQINMEGK